MRHLAVLTLGLGLAALTSSAQAMSRLDLAAGPAPMPWVTPVEYFCSPGFVPTYGGRCVATAARDQIELFVETPIDRPVYRVHRRHGVRARY